MSNTDSINAIYGKAVISYASEIFWKSTINVIGILLHSLIYIKKKRSHEKAVQNISIRKPNWMACEKSRYFQRDIGTTAKQMFT